MEEARTEPALTFRGRPPIASAVGSALLLWTTFPPLGWHWLAWLALVPFLTLVSSKRSASTLYLAAWAGGFVFWGLAVQWVRLTDESAWIAWLAMALALSAFWPLALVMIRLAVHRLKLPLMLAAPIVWVALEYVRAYIFTGFPWYYLAHSQHAILPVIQIADFAGSLGVSMVIVAVNAWIVDLLSLPLLCPGTARPRLTNAQVRRLVAVACFVLGTLAYGGHRLGSSTFRDGPRVAMLQSNMVQHLKDAHTHEETLAIYQRLITRAVGAPRKPDLIVWPETSYPYHFVQIASDVSTATIAEQLQKLGAEKSFTADLRLHQRAEILAHLRGMTDAAGVPMVIGGIVDDHRSDALSRYNAALLFQPGNPAPQIACKMHLVPFGEYVPLIETFPWLTVFTPYSNGHIPSLSHARAPAWLDLGSYRLAAAICFEDTVPQVFRRLMAEAKDGRHPDIVLNLSNDGWFHDSSEHEMHLAASVFRAVEHRVPLARAVNTGISAIIDGNGRVVASMPTKKEDQYLEGVLAGVVPLDDRTAAYTVWGDWLGQSCLAITLGWVPLAWIYPKLRPRRDNP